VARKAATEADKKVQEKRARLRDDFAFYAQHALKIRTKAGGVDPFTLNNVQRFIHTQAEKQLFTTGRVRVLVLKGRQEGVSTYVQGRFYWKTTHGRGKRAFILTHRDEATRNLFAIGKRFHENTPAVIRPDIKASNATELEFGALDSGYRVGTAKAQGVARSDTIQFFHGSEVAWWANAEEHAAGALQAVPDERGSEVWLETTANGMGGLFCTMWQMAERGENDYLALFCPWFWHEEYTAEVPVGWEPPEEFAEYMRLHSLTLGQIRWAYLKNADLAAADNLSAYKVCWRFKQEYPATAQEAFQASGAGSFIPSEIVMQARKAALAEDVYAPLVMGCDFARGENDFNTFYGRKGRIGGHRTGIREKFHSGDTMDIAGRLIGFLERFPVVMAFLDTGGGGAQVYDICCSRGYGGQLTLIDFGSSPYDSRQYLNKRAEMYGNGKDWLADAGGADIDDDDELHTQLMATGFKHNEKRQVILEPKDKIRDRLGVSPDLADSWALTFAEAVSWEQQAEEDFWDDFDRASNDQSRSVISGY
jgi:hypothetical protein